MNGRGGERKDPSQLVGEIKRVLRLTAPSESHQFCDGSS